MRHFVIFIAFCMCMCVETNRDCEHGSVDAPPSFDASVSCAEQSPAWLACLNAIQRADSCCWDAFGVSREWTIEPAIFCQRIAATGRDPMTACRSYGDLFVEGSSAGECTFNSAAASSGAITGIGLCCCGHGEPCLTTATGGVMCGENRR